MIRWWQAHCSSFGTGAFIDEATGLGSSPPRHPQRRWTGALRICFTRRRIQAASGSFDHVIIESLPFARVVDATAILQLSHRIIFMVAWKRTPREAIPQALKNSSLQRHKVAGVAFNMIDEQSMTSHGRYGYYGSKYYGHYYNTRAATDAA